MEINRAEIAIRLVEERARLGFSQRDFANQLSVSGETVRRYEIGEREIGVEFMARAAGLGVDVQYVLTGVASKNKAEVEAATQPSIAINGSTNVIGFVQNGATVNQIKTDKHVTTVKAEVKPGEDHITQEQAAKLTALVNEIVELEAKLKQKPKTHRSVWGTLNAHMGVTRYLLIPAIGYERAEKYLRQWLGRLNSGKSASVKDGDAWRKRKYAYIKINSKDDPDSVDRYLAKNFGASSLSDLSNDELEKVYRYVAAKKRK